MTSASAAYRSSSAATDREASGVGRWIAVTAVLAALALAAITAIQRLMPADCWSGVDERYAADAEVMDSPRSEERRGLVGLQRLSTWPSK